MKKYLLELTVFITGLGVMVFELVGSRILAPFVGTTVMVWSVLIGVIMAALSLGYWWGGRIADKKADYKTFSLIIFAAAILVALTALIKLPVINFLEHHLNRFRWEAFWASLILFAPASFFMAAVSPYAIRLRLASLKESGVVVGNLYAVSTTGSIAGTFLTGLILIPIIGGTKILFGLASLLLVASVIVFSQRWLVAKVAAAILMLGVIPFTDKIDFHFLPLNFIHSAYQDFALVNGIDTYNDSGRPVLQIYTGPTTVQSAMFTDNDDELVIPYTRFFRVLSDFFYPGKRNTLVIGGAAYSYPKDFLKNNSGNIDVVEIDPKMTEIAKQSFNLKDDPRLANYSEDGRTYLNRNQKKYDVVIVDSFRTFVAPFQLTTREAVQRMYDSLSDNGVVMVNIIQSINGDTGKFFRAEYKTYKQIFPQLYVFRVNSESPDDTQNLILLATKSTKRVEVSSADEYVNSYTSHIWDEPIADDMPVITDEFAPVADYMLSASRTIKSARN